MERLNEKLDNNKIPLSFSRKDELLSARLDGVSFYVSLLKSKNEINDWYQMAKDFELIFDKKPIDKATLLERYQRLGNSSSNPYTKIHFAVGISIIEEMEKFSNMRTYSFQ